MGEWELVGNLKGADGVSSSHYSHVQTVPSTTWPVNHNLGYRPAVSVLDVDGVDISDGVEVVHINTNQCTVNMGFAIAGRAECS